MSIGDVLLRESEKIEHRFYSKNPIHLIKFYDELVEFRIRIYRGMVSGHLMKRGRDYELLFRTSVLYEASLFKNDNLEVLLDGKITKEFGTDYLIVNPFRLNDSTILGHIAQIPCLDYDNVKQYGGLLSPKDGIVSSDEYKLDNNIFRQYIQTSGIVKGY